MLWCLVLVRCYGRILLQVSFIILKWACLSIFLLLKLLMWCSICVLGLECLFVLLVFIVIIFLVGWVQWELLYIFFICLCKLLIFSLLVVSVKLILFILSCVMILIIKALFFRSCGKWVYVGLVVMIFFFILIVYKVSFILYLLLSGFVVIRASFIVVGIV